MVLPLGSDWERNMDEDIDALSREALIAEVRKLRAAIRAHRDASGQELCWHHPALWSLLPEQTSPDIAVPAWPQFMRGCVRYRQSLDEQAGDAPRIDQHFGEPSRPQRTDMERDEAKIRELASTWMQATKTQDVDVVLELMTDDAVFLVAGKPPMRKPDFEAAARAQALADAPRLEGHSEIRELQVSGDWAFMWSELSVVATPLDGGPSTTRSGHTLTVCRRQGGRWLLARDANLLGPPADEGRMAKAARSSRNDSVRATVQGPSLSQRSTKG